MERCSWVSLVSLSLALAGCGGGDDAQIKGGASSGSVAASSSGAGAGGGSASVADSSSATTGPGGGAASSTSAGPGGGTPIPAGVISTSQLSILEAETHVAVSSNGWVVAAWIAEKMGGMSTNGYRVSKDGGTTWDPVQELASPNPQVASDPVLVFNQQNDLFMTWIGFQFDNNGNPFDMHVYVAKAPSGSTTFGAPIEISKAAANDGFDKPWITVTPKNTILVTWAKTSTGGIFVSRSVDDGASFQNVKIVEDGGFRNLVYPCVEPTTGRVYATYHAGGGVGLRWSDDDGATWLDANKSAVADMNETVPAFEDPTCAAQGNEVWVSYGLTPDNNMGNALTAKLNKVRIAHSPDGGVSIDFRTDALDLGASKYAMLPQLSREANGSFDVVYYGGDVMDDTNASYRSTHSSDGGQTWGPSQPIATPLIFNQDRSSVHWLGDYVGLTVDAGFLYTTYVDNTGMFSHVAFAKQPLP